MKWAGKLGFCESVETEPSVWEDVVTERQAYGDVLQAGRRFDLGDKVNGDVTVTNRLSILADPWTRDHIFCLKYATFCGTAWVVSNAEVQYPRIILTLGGVYHGANAG